MKSPEKYTIVVFAVSAILTTLFLFFIDEGYYNFKWMTSIGNWIAFIIYIVPIFLGQLIVYVLIPEKMRNRGISWVSILGGTSLALLFIINVIFANLK